MSIMVTRSSMPPMEEYIAEIRDIWQSRWLTNMGVKHQAFQAALQDYMQTEYVELRGHYDAVHVRLDDACHRAQ